jgi:hypothetical protein
VWRQFGRWIVMVMDAIIWGWDMLMMYVAALFLIPLCVIGALKVMGITTVWSAFAEAGLEHAWFRLMLLGAPVWLAVTLYARFAGTPWAIAFCDRLERWKWAVIWATCAAMGVFAVLALIFAT